MSFAQFEREVTAESIRDKIAASKQKGLWMGGSVPIGYIANGRTLKIHDEEAKMIELIYSLYHKHRNIRTIKEELDRMKIYSRERSLSKNADQNNTENTGQPPCESNNQKNSKSIGSQMNSGKHPFSRGHIHFILTNPIYAGRIRHKDKTFEGQHPFIIDPILWDQVQAQLESHARKKRDRKTGLVDGSKLQGKLFDENGESLTPSHTKKGKRRYRYYVSHRLIANTKSANGSNWRLPAKRLEDEILAAITNHLIQNQARILNDNTSVEHIKKLSDQTQKLKTTLYKNKNVQKQTTYTIGFNCIHRIDIKPGSAEINLNETEIANASSISPELINDNILTLSIPFQIKKRGVETKIVLGNIASNHDEILVKNIAQAHYFLDQLQSGMSIPEIASSYGRKTKNETHYKACHDSH
ncbi:recombinase family protein [Lentilitoribacter sp. Alg239-R112]|uniref:recombinase family protein n=1 Tax=Lentilitoribacter sp. Alg239-R112 TaxID=2305987 RepID=UPI0013A6D320|nr:recombinase family protein [Lentilitoribacter sp. Alg239-R112]